MQSRRSARRAPAAEGRGAPTHGRRGVFRIAALAAAAALVACSSSGPTAPTAPKIRQDPALLPPLPSYPLTSPPELAARVDVLFGSLKAGGDLADVEARAKALLDEAPDFPPAAVLMAQVEYLRLDDPAALARLEPIAAELPGYTACQVLLGYAAERGGEIVSAYEAFFRASEAVAGDLEGGGAGLAGERAEALRERAAEIVFHRLEDALARGHLEDAEDHRAWLEEWIADEPILLRAAWRITAAEGDREGELEAACRLVGLEPTEELRRRCAELEIEVGDVRNGLELFRKLAAELPDDPELADQLERAKFRWRLELLPSHVRDLGRKGELTRADLATFLYWLVPQVRSSRVTDPPIATDILEHPHRDEILKVMDLALMRVDELLHRFDPDRPATRLTTLAVLLRLLDFTEREPPCLGGARVLGLPEARSWVCDKAASCGFIPEVAECLPRARISGDEVLDFFRHGLDLMGAGQSAGL